MRAIAVALLVVLAGCSALAPGTDRPTVTPAPAPTDSPLPPGVESSGVTGASALAAAHAAALGNSSYTLVTNRTVRTANGSLRSALIVRLALSPGPSRDYHARVSVDGPAAPLVIGEPPTRAEYWANDEVYLRRRTVDDRTAYSRYDDTDAYVGTWSFWLGTAALDLGPETDLRSTLRGFETRVAADSPERERVHLVGTTARSDEFVDDPAEVERVENATLHAFVTESGFVESYHVVYDATLDDGERVRVRRSVRFEGVGTTTVDRPSWYDEAMSEG
ncbi:hypothetical protein C475_16179 [Halosimplex carlsbadense 2-9-1]|uniref:Lipoprotein n=1 Tax=Halosimplex carlsbadense 2-9-1 TaxID=797114 RepID=M0CKP9_9EURY|nr:hypothetical protein [Halosimplex carlsbadense]ELZ23203.1 hypothetical protein C475_16179 [Halosimplex carlsbadense 2-9-1]